MGGFIYLMVSDRPSIVCAISMSSFNLVLYFSSLGKLVASQTRQTQVQFNFVPDPISLSWR